MTTQRFLAIWLFAAILVPQSATSQEEKPEQVSPLPDGWKKAKFGMSTEEVLASYAEAALERNEPELLLQTYILSAPTQGIGRVTFSFFKDRLFKVALNFDLNEVEQRFQICLYEKKYGPCHEKSFDWRPNENASKFVWMNPKYMIQLGQLVTTPTGKKAKASHYLAAIYTDIKIATEYEEYAKNAAPRKHALGWEDF
ncbi:MAG: hypothetical protein GXP25_03945 [Planctomycetes bacterium]|nr:hypothetical protein [Planctomycetota bacterium]